MRQAAFTGADRADSRQELHPQPGQSELTPRLSPPKVDIHPNVHHTSVVGGLGDGCLAVNDEDGMMLRSLGDEDEMRWEMERKSSDV
ncbi:hypothetical protein NQZ68_001005 [Dissostichus eleginoides]|nr:hypothetical protein NQZ68_001005 [Dissostichus eleginoides]